MNADTAKQFQVSLLLTLSAAADIGLQEASMLPRLRLEYRELTAPELAAQLRALADRQLAVSYEPALGASRWRITGLGTAALKEAGLA